MEASARVAPDAEGKFLGLPPGTGVACERAWRAFVADPPGSRALAQEAFREEGSDRSRAYAGICLAYHQARGGEVAAASDTVAAARALCEAARDSRASRLASIVAAYVEVARGHAAQAVTALEKSLAEITRDDSAHALDRFLACHALALAHGRLGQLDQVLHHHYANLLLLEHEGASTPLAVVLLNLSSTLTAIDDWEEALELARRAVECCNRMSNAALKRRAEINVALALRFLGRLEEALHLLARLRREPFRDAGSDFALYINSAEALAQAGRADEARGCLEQARAMRNPSGDAHERANIAWVDGLIASRAGEVAQAQRSLELARDEASALRKVHVPLLPRIVQELAHCYARTGDHARAFETFRRFHEAYEARLGYTTRVRYTGRQSRDGAAAVTAALERGQEDEPAAASAVDRARLNEALRRTLAAAGSAGEALAGWSAPTIESIGTVARDLGVTAGRIGGLVQELAATPGVSTTEGRPPVRVQVFGDFEVDLSGEPLRFGRKRPERPLALLRYLAVHGRRGVQETQAADALWPDLEGDAARRVLAVNLHRLRYLLGGNDRVVHRGRRLTLGTRVVRCDALVFEELLDRAAASAVGEERERLTAEALEVYRAPLALDEDREPWAIPARRRLHSRFLLACAGQGARQAAAGRWEEAMATYARGLHVDPCAEELCLGLMRGALALERREEGAAAYARLATELAAAGRGRPAAAIEALHQELTTRAG